MNAVLKVFVVVLVAAIVVSSCKKDEDPYAQYTPEREAALIEEWLDAMVKGNKDIDTTATGLFYIVDKEGAGETVKTGDEVTVKYTGMFVNGSIFDASAYHSEAGTYTYIHKDTDMTKRMITGWEEGIEVMKKGGVSAFLIPSAKAYGPTGSMSIPPYCPLIFVIEVVDIK